MSFLRGDYATMLGRQSELACLTEVHSERLILLIWLQRFQRYMHFTVFLPISQANKKYIINLFLSKVNPTKKWLKSFVM